MAVDDDPPESTRLSLVIAWTRRCAVAEKHFPSREARKSFCDQRCRLNPSPVVSNETTCRRVGKAPDSSFINALPIPLIRWMTDIATSARPPAPTRLIGNHPALEQRTPVQQDHKGTATSFRRSGPRSAI